ncbi:unnamed protein product [Vitrella brassicaformis CCMP3155]|uniref:Sugar phosphate transporter domain-containing protein n=2 Tax=Vitrella brassicaformis TaxID=1169539 RepID=A0A0G4EGL4_VITBC|nr:unnamed protein product [Vitrella brassicaformis CCMP3155]|eukprot:CEL94625.1 unnamed protein product [Vitrella brassicaformis CCMP3155]
MRLNRPDTNPFSADLCSDGDEAASIPPNKSPFSDASTTTTTRSSEASDEATPLFPDRHHGKADGGVQLPWAWSGQRHGPEVRKVLEIVYALLLWYVTGIGLTALNKEMFDIRGFNFPLLVTSLHFLAQSVALPLLLRYGGCLAAKWRPLDWRRDGVMLPVIAACSAVAVISSNAAYVYSSIALMTTIKATIPLATYLCGISLGIEHLSWRLMGIVFMVSASIWLAIEGLEIQSWLGILLNGLVVISSAVRWCVVQCSCKHYSSVQLLAMTQPIATACMVPVALTLEATKLQQYCHGFASDRWGATLILLLVGLSTVMAFLVTYANFHLVSVTSGLTLALAAQTKFFLTILVGVLAYHERVQFMSWMGLVLCSVGIVMYGRLRAAEKAASKDDKTHRNPFEGGGESDRRV